MDIIKRTYRGRVAAIAGAALAWALVGTVAAGNVAADAGAVVNSAPMTLKQSLALPNLKLRASATPKSPVGSTRTQSVTKDGWTYQIVYRMTAGGWRIVKYAATRANATAVAVEVPVDAAVSRHGAAAADKPSVAGRRAKPLPEPADIAVPAAPRDPSYAFRTTIDACPIDGFPQVAGSWTWLWVPASTSDRSGRRASKGHYAMVEFKVHRMAAGCS